MHPSPQYLERSSVIGCVRKYGLSKKMCHEGIYFFSEIEVFGKEKAIYVIYQMSDSKEKKHIKRVKKRSSEIFGVEMKVFPKKVIRKNFRPLNSAPSLRLCP